MIRRDAEWKDFSRSIEYPGTSTSHAMVIRQSFQIWSTRATVPFKFISGNFDLSHKINELSFGDNVDFERGGNSLGGFNSEKEIQDNFLGITYTYFLDIIENNEIDMSDQTAKESYLYTARLNEVILAQFPMLLFRY